MPKAPTSLLRWLGVLGLTVLLALLAWSAWRLVTRAPPANSNDKLVPGAR